MKNIALFLLTIMVSISCSNAKRTSEPGTSIKHIVIVWLNEPGNTQHRQQLIDAAQVLTNIPGVLSVSAGEPVASERAIVDDSFDIAYIFTFENSESMRNYLIHADHRKVVANVIKPLVAKMVVYDFLDESESNGFNENLKNH
jgi:hypothetical protein